MKPILSFLLVAIGLTFAANELAAQEEEKGEILHGFVEAVDGNKITVNQRGKGNQTGLRHSRRRRCQGAR